LHPPYYGEFGIQLLMSWQMKDYYKQPLQDFLAAVGAG
jgi:hypothetical protein